MSQHGCPERLSNRSKGFQDEGPCQPTMEVLVETLTGTAFEMTVSPSDTVFAIKSKICRVEGIPVSQQHLLYNLKELEDSASLRSLGITDGARLRLVLGMRGGPISTRRLPPPPGEPWRDIERLLDTNRDEVEWGGGSGCKVTVLVFRDGERVNMLRVRENRDGTYSPLDHTKYSSSLTHLAEGEGGSEAGGGAGAVQQNAVTLSKMLELRARMESLSVRRRADRAAGDKPEIQKTRSEEILSVPSLLDDSPTEAFSTRAYTPYSEAEDSFPPLYDGGYTRYDYECTFADRYTLLPPIGTRPDGGGGCGGSGEQPQPEAERLKLSDALAGSILVKGRRDREDDAAILEECLDSAVEECHIRQGSPQLAAKNLAPIPAAEYGPLVGGEAGGWRMRGFGSSSQLASGSAAAASAEAHSHSHSASSLHARAAPPAAKRHPPLSDALFSSSTSDLEQLRRNRLLPALSRHRNREHLHLSDDTLDAPPPPPPPPPPRPRARPHPHPSPPPAAPPRDPSPTPPPQAAEEGDKEKKVRIRCGFCRKRLSIATVHRCRCGAQFCAPHRYAEVHGCAYDYKAHAHRYLQRANPLVSAPKLPKI